SGRGPHRRSPRTRSGPCSSRAAPSGARSTPRKAATCGCGSPRWTRPPTGAAPPSASSPPTAPVASRSGEAPDDELVRRYVAGDAAAFTVLVTRHERRVYNLAYRMLGREADAREATQDEFLTALRKLS